MTYTQHYDSPLGGILLAADEEGLTGLWFDGQKYFARTLPKEYAESETPVLCEAKRWLDIYFSGREPDFTPQLHPAGSAFQQAVWALLLEIPYGKTTTYGALARKLAEKQGLTHMSAQAVGGAVYYSGCAAANMGHKIAVLPKAALSQLDVTAAFHEKAPSISVFPLNSPHSFVTKNVYHTADRERRTSTVDSLIAPYTTDEVPVDQIDAAIWHLAGLAGGDIPNEMIPFAAKHAMVAIDVQTMLRWVENGGMVYHDWKEKKELLPYIRFLKTDAAEAEILTGLTDRAEAAKVLYGWGAKEILITHNTEVLVYDGHDIYTCPIKARNLSGRTGRGDTTFAGYINERLTKDIPTALQTATALVSLKMETPGPFTGTRQDVEDYIKLMY